MKIAVLTDPNSAAGYRLGGLEVALAHDGDEARETLTRLIETDEYALIIVDMTLLPDPYQAVARLMRHRDLPVLLEAPSHRQAVMADDDPEAYIRRMVKDTMGYEIKL
jgi:V/A-type H+-transporting ATPase subunit F